MEKFKIPLFIDSINVTKEEFINQIQEAFQNFEERNDILHCGYNIFRTLIITRTITIKSNIYYVEGIPFVGDSFDATTRIMEKTNEEGNIFNYNQPENADINTILNTWYEASKRALDYLNWCIDQSVIKIDIFLNSNDFPYKFKRK